MADNKHIKESLEKRKAILLAKRKKLFIYFLYVIIIVMIIVFLVNKFIVSVVTVEGESMEQTLQNDDKLLIRKVGIDTEDIQVDDIIYFKGLDDRIYIKRVIAKPGDVVEIINKMVFINGIQKIEDYIVQKDTEVYDQNRWYLKDDEFFVLGDNRNKNMSRDSRLFGPININQILGKVIFDFSN